MSSTYSREVAAAFDAVAATYNDHYSTRGDLAESAIVYGLAGAIDPGHGTFVDLGCGPATALSWMSDLLSVHRYLGVDISKGMVKEAQVVWPEYTFMTGSEENLVPGAAGFIMGAFTPLQHVEDLPRFARRIREALAPQGRFLLMGRPRKASTRVLGSEALTRPYSAADVASAFWWASDLKVEGLRYLVPKWLPVRAQIRLLPWTSEFFAADRHEWLVVMGGR